MMLELVEVSPRRAKLLFIVLSLGGVALCSSSSTAYAADPQIDAVWVSGVSANSAVGEAEINPGGVSTTFHFEYIAEASYEANLNGGKEGFAGAARAPSGAEGGAGSGSSNQHVLETIRSLGPETTYRYRLIAKSTAGSVLSPEHSFTTQGFGGPLVLLDSRSWELASPVEKNGGEIQGFGANSGGGVLQSGAQGGSVTFSSASSFGEGGMGAPTASQYISRRGPGGWSSENITAPLFSGGYGEEPDGVPYQLFSTDLARGLLAAPAYPPLPGTDAPAGYQNYYLRDDIGGGLEALITHADTAGLLIPPQKFELRFAGASANLGHLVLSTCAALTAEAIEVPDGSGGCESASPNLYEWGGSGLQLINLPPGASVGVPGAELAAPGGAISDDGSRVYWTDGADLYLREGGTHTEKVDQATGGAFQTASSDGSVAFFTKSGHLYRYDAMSLNSTDLTPAGGVTGVLGASANGSYVYYLTSNGLFLNHNGVNTPIASSADAANVPPSTGTARVSADGIHLAFTSSAELTPYDNIDQNTGKPDPEVYLYDANVNALVCASCNPTGERPSGPSSIPGAIVNGQGEGATQSYKPRVLSADGRRVFFDSGDALVLQDSNNKPDVYEWEAQGAGSCGRAGGCVELISSGQIGEGASFVDASTEGTDAFFLTDASLVRSDPPGSVDLYDARENGGFPEPPNQILCEEDACQPLPSAPDDPAPGTLVPSAGNPPVHFPKAHHKKRRHGKRHQARGAGRGHR